MKDKIKALHTDARKAKDSERVALLSTILGEFSQIESSLDPKTILLSDDEKYIKVITKMSKSAVACKNFEEVKFLAQFMPQKMNEAQIYGALDKLNLPEGSKIKDYMKAWSSKPALKGKADMKFVTQVIKENFL